MYGGAMVTGSSSNPQFQGNTFARKDVVFVSFNTRESIWAYPNSAELTTSDRENDTQQSQNFGILDVEAALDWIHENIAGRFVPNAISTNTLIKRHSLRWQPRPHRLRRPLIRIRPSRPLPLEQPRDLAKRRRTNERKRRIRTCRCAPKPSSGHRRR